MKKLFVVILGLCLVAVLGFAGYRGYSIWTQKRLMRTTHEYLEKGNLQGALLSLRNVLELNPHNLEACRLMGDFAELMHSDQVIEWRRRVVEIDPESLTNRLVLARTAIGFGDVATAQKTLDGVSANGKKTSLFYQIEGLVALANRRLDLAEAQFVEALKLEPNNPGLQLNLALIRLQGSNPQAAAAGRTTLQNLTANPAIRCEAWRQLAMDAVGHTNFEQALTYSRQVLAETNASFNDRLLHLDLLRITQDARQPAFLARLQGECTTNSAAAYQLGKWLLANSKPETTLAWVKTLPATTRTNLPVPLLETDCHLLLKDWSGLLTSLTGQYWGRLECVRLVSCVRAYKELGQATSAKTTWIQALKATGNQAGQLQQLMDAATRWKWPAEQEEILWAVVNHYPDDMGALQALSGQLCSEGQTRALMKLSSQALQGHQNNLELMNNVAVTALLLEAWEKKPHELAREVYTRCPTNASYISTYAFSQLLQKKPADALKTMEQIKPEQLEKPGLAAYYGVILHAAGKQEQARHYLELAAKATLLPEERKLVERATGR